MSSLAVRAAITGGHYLNRLFNPYSCQSGKTRFKTRVVDELGCRLSIPHDKPLTVGFRFLEPTQVVVVVRCSPEKAPDQFPINGRWLPAVAEAFNQREFIVDPRNNRWKKTMTNIVLPGVENKTIYKHYLLRSLMVLGISAAATTGLALAGAATGIVSSVLIFSVIKLLQLSARVRHYVHLNTNLS